MWRSCPALKLHKEKPLCIALPSSVWNLTVRVPVIADLLRQLFSILLGQMKTNMKQTEDHTWVTWFTGSKLRLSKGFFVTE